MELLPDSVSTGWAIALVVASWVTSAFTATFGVGGGLAMLALLLTLLPPAIVIPVHGVIQLGSNAGRAHAYREHIDWPLVRWFVAGALIGIFIASQLFVTLPEGWLLLAMGVFILWSVWSPKLSFAAIATKSYVIVGAVLTFLTFFLGATGPLMAAVMHDRSPIRQVYIATHAATMCIQHILKILVFGIFGFAFAEWLLLIAAMVISGYAGTLSGKALLSRLPESMFRRLFKILLSLLAIRLIISAFKAINI